MDKDAPPRGTKQLLGELGAEKFAQWMRGKQRVLVTDTTLRDAHQSLLATRMRSRDMLEIAPVYAKLMPDLLSLECWGGATFDVAMRFLGECPWERLEALRERVPNILLQMLLRSANAVGYTNYPDNVVQYFVRRAAASGIDLFRVFDSLNGVDNMRVAIDAVRETGAICEAAICYTGDLSDPNCTKYDLKYYVRMARKLEDGRRACARHQRHGGTVPAARSGNAGARIARRGRVCRSLPHARHQRHFGGERACGGGCGVRCGRCGDGFDERAHVAAEPRLDRRSAAPRTRAQRVSIPNTSA